MEQKRLDEIVQALTKKGVNKACSKCGHLKFSVVGESFISIQDNPNVMQIGGPAIPTAIVACDNCGYVTQHALLLLGLAGSAK